MNKHTIVLNGDDYALLISALQDVINTLEDRINNSFNSLDIRIYSDYQNKVRYLLNLINDNNENKNET